MSKRVNLAIFIFLVIIIQVSFLTPFFSKAPVPNLILIIILFWASRKNFSQVFPWLVLAGFLSDIFMFIPLGESVLLFSLVAWGVNFIAATFLTKERAWRFGIILLLLAAGVLANELLKSILEGLIASVREKNLTPFRFREEFSSVRIILVNLLAVAILYHPLRKIERFFPFGLEGQK